MPPSPRRRALRGLLLAPAFVTSLAGCYAHAPVAGARLAPGLPVNLVLTDQGTYDLTPRIGAAVRELRGRVVATDDTTITVALTSATDVRGIPTTWTGEAVSFRRTQVARVEERRLSRTRSLLLAAGLLGIAAVIGGISLTGDGSGPGEGGNTQ